ncbi:Carboxylic ester hydrolase [Aphelenchoides bicaudatus]|nr:Carboxylic ester hydrolase [Aphelenchoides bicaudatus]
MKIEKSPVVNASCGPIQGRLFDFEDGHKALAFQGIPFARAPIGELRFKKPEALPKWSEVRDCSQFSTMFHCVPSVETTQKMSEDSLHLNVFTPVQSDKHEKFPVLFFIHGGGFVVDSAKSLGDEEICRLLCSKGIIVVTCEYRLGIFGFLTLKNGEAKGNYGLWDTTFALKWTVDNIEAFGGDSKNITVAGQSAGGVAADLLSLSPHSRDLFQQLILMAGTSDYELLNMNPKNMQSVFVEYAKHLGAEINKSEPVDEQVYKFYKECDAERLALGVRPVPEFKFWPDMRFLIGPCYDNDFFPKQLDELKKEAPRKRIINGLTEHEGLILTVQKAFQPQLSWFDVISDSLKSIRPDFSEELRDKFVTQAIGKVENDPEFAKRCVQVLSDIMMNSGSLKTTETRTKHGDHVYNYVFGYYKKGTLGGMEQFLPFAGATHCMELPYLFGKNLFGDFKIEDVDEEVVDQFTTSLSNFVKTGSPNNTGCSEKWKEFTPDNDVPYFYFGQNVFETRKGFCSRSSVWNQIFSEHKRKVEL